MRRNRRAKIIATLGPVSATSKRIRELFEAGADVFRLNFSHGTHDDHRQRVEQIRKLEIELRHPIGIIMDLQGPKLRLGQFQGGEAKLMAGAPFRLDMLDTLGDSRRAPMPHPEIFKTLKPGDRLLVDDGKMCLRVERCDKDHAETIVVTGGIVRDRKGVNVPDAVLKLSPLTKKDLKDLEFGLNLGVDWVALSFVQEPGDVAQLRSLVGDRAGIISKLEKPSAIEHLDGILELSDAVMVARGDLGVELPPEDVPALQKHIIRACRKMGKPVVVATQMLDSMITAPTPTRAEASDVATAVYDGADTVMLSAETASGDYPMEAVTIMDRIIHRVETDESYQQFNDIHRTQASDLTGDAITAAARQAADSIAAAAIVTFTNTGSTSLRTARERPTVPILCLTPKAETARRMTLVWGIHSVQTEDIHDFTEMVNKAERIASEEEFAVKDDRLVITAGVPFGRPGATNNLRITRVK